MKEIREWHVPHDRQMHLIGGGRIIDVHTDPYVDDGLIVWTEEDAVILDPDRAVMVVVPGVQYLDNWHAEGASGWAVGGAVRARILIAERKPVNGYIKD